MRRVFIDTAYLIAHFDSRDSLHPLAMRIADGFLTRPAQFFVTHLVLAEFLAHYSRARSDLRGGAGVYVDLLLNRQDVIVLELSDDLFAAGLNRYRSRPDKRYSLADCVSMVVCADLSITEVLTSDTDFETEGLTILLKD